MKPILFQIGVGGVWAACERGTSSGLSSSKRADFLPLKESVIRFVPQNRQWTEGRASQIHRLASDSAEVLAYWATSNHGTARRSTRATGIIAAARRSRYQ